MTLPGRAARDGYHKRASSHASAPTALDTNSSLPLFNSLTHLTYLTSTSPRIREIMTFDGGLERLVALLREFCLSPPPPENPALLYGLAPVASRPLRRTPLLNPTSFDKHAAYRFSLAFQSVVNIGVRGSEDIRARVVQAGTLDVVGCVLEAWLAAKGFAVGPSASASGLPRETREQRAARRQAQAELRSRQQAAELERALRRQVEINHAQSGAVQGRIAQASPTSETPTDTSTNATPGASTPTGAVTVPGRDRSGTVIGRPVWDGQGTIRARHPPAEPPADDNSGDTSRAETETEDDADGDVDMEQLRPRPHPRRAVGIVSDNTENEAALSPAATVPAVSDAHIIVDPTMVAGDGVGVEDGLVSLEQNDDFALGAPPGAPGAIDGTTPRNTNPRVGRIAPDVTPRAIPVPLPGAGPTGAAGRVEAPPTLRPPLRTLPTPLATAMAHPHHHRDVLAGDTGLYRDEDVLLGLQLLAYLSKYPHVRQAFYKPRPTFHPATAAATAHQRSQLQTQAVAGPSSAASVVLPPVRETHGFFKAFGAVRGKEKAKATTVASTSAVSAAGPSSATPASSAQASAPAPRQTNVFSLVERFTFRPSSSESELPNAPPPLPADIQYWAGVIMRNACRKDDSRGGIRQCANSQLTFYSFSRRWMTDHALSMQCYVVNGRVSRVSSRSADGAGRPSTAGKNVRAQRGRRATGSGAVPRITTGTTRPSMVVHAPQRAGPRMLVLGTACRQMERRKHCLNVAWTGSVPSVIVAQERRRAAPFHEAPFRPSKLRAQFMLCTGSPSRHARTAHGTKTKRTRTRRPWERGARRPGRGRTPAQSAVRCSALRDGAQEQRPRRGRRICSSTPSRWITRRICSWAARCLVTTLSQCRLAHARPMMGRA